MSLTASRSTSIHNSVSPSLTLSPTVGPNMATYVSLLICVSEDISRAPGSGTCPNPLCTKFVMMLPVLVKSTMPEASRFPPVIFFRPAIAHRVTCLVSPGSNRTAVPAGMSKRLPYALALSKARALLVSMKW